MDRYCRFHSDMIFKNEAFTLIRSTRKEDAVEFEEVRDAVSEILGILKEGYINQKRALALMFAVDWKVSKKLMVW